MKTFKALTKNFECLIKLIKLLEELVAIEKDCLKLKNQGNFTEYAEGQLDLIHIIQEKI